ncbi:hypothetical protein APY94_10420 [Thermococcus celericrescens]|uniref:Uncharacterized protein n=1 Tax=Thermococcus celericrescens TaxID=227598 RepID=A0A100XW94_9EURY|nr:hypothetical protein [Thermococcus celericrescens]KUH32302.1 hypothetical protein APY94_10420 [Thermococcus celericrescens]
MRAKIMLVLLVLIFMGTTTVSATAPAWLKPGAYVTYAVIVPKDARFGTNSVMIKLDMLNGRSFEALYPYLTRTMERNVSRDENYVTALWPTGTSYLTFEVLSVDNDTAKILVTLKLHDVVVERPDLANASVLVLSEVLTLDLKSGMYVRNGMPVARPSFFVDTSSPPGPGAVLLNVTVPEGGAWVMRIKNLSYSRYRDVEVLTHLRTFHPPFIYLESDVVRFNLHGPDYSFSGGTGFSALYDPSTGLMIASDMFSTPPELVLMGVISSTMEDVNASRALRKLLAEGSNKRWLQGWNLFATNVEFRDENPFERPRSPFVYYFVPLAIIALAVGIRDFWRWVR